MSTTWYAKIDGNFHSNRKAIKAGRVGREVYVFVLCINAQKGAPGLLSIDDLEPWYLAQQLQMSESEAQRGIDACVAADLLSIDDGIVTISGWTEDYAKYPLTRPEIQQRYRERTKDKKRKATNQNVTAVTMVGNAGSNALPPVTQEGRKEGREGERSAPAFDPTDIGAQNQLAEATWRRLSELRLTIGREFGLANVLPLTPITPASANQKGYRDLRQRIAEEGQGASAICDRVLEVLTAQARETGKLDWLSEKAFGEGAWRHARETIPKWRAPKPSESGSMTFNFGGDALEVKAG